MNPLQLFAITISVLLLSLPLSSATSISIGYGQLPRTNTKLPSLLTRNIYTEPSGFDYNVVLDLSGGLQTLQTLYLFKCEDLSPGDCAASISPEIRSFSNNKLLLKLLWSSLNKGGKGNLMLLVKTSNPSGGSWLVYWHEIEKTGQSFSFYSEDVPQINVEAKSLTSIGDISDFVKMHAMLPMNEIESITFPTASKLYELRSDAPPMFTSFLNLGNKIEGIPSDFDIVLPYVSGRSMNGITIAKNPSTAVCRDKFCDPEENAANCCYDCGCPGGQYCDDEKGCKLNDNIKLKVIQPTVTAVQGCNKENNVKVTLELENQPTIMQIDEMQYILNGTEPQSLYCEPSNNKYTCEIRVPADPNCGEGIFIHRGNSITFKISYPDGSKPNKATKELKVYFPDVTVGSFTCGNRICESTLTESSSNCCFDCGCPGEGQICDWDPKINWGICTQPPASSSLAISNTKPKFFNYYSSQGNKVTFDYEATNPPKSLSMKSPSCDISCVSESKSCDSHCSVSCSQLKSSGSCSLTFTIDSYDNMKGYSLRPNITFPITYNNGSQTIQSSLSSDIPPGSSAISIGPHFCGDLVCNQDETSANCCFDCDCSKGEFCSTENPNKANPSRDVCVKDDVSIVVDSIGETKFTDSSLTHKTKIDFHITNPPTGFAAKPPTCVIGGGMMECLLNCKLTSDQTAGKQSYTCNMTIPSVAYQHSPFFNKNTKKLHIEPNTLNISVSYNNGSMKVVRPLSSHLPEITVALVSHCGYDGCEEILGENSKNCCIDCPCSETYGLGSICIPGGRNPNSTCVQNSTIKAFISEIKPKPRCEIQSPTAGGNCMFTEAAIFHISVASAPGDLKVKKVVMHYQNNSLVITPQCSHSSGLMNCSIHFDNIMGQPAFSGGNLTPKNQTEQISFSITGEYTDNRYKISTLLTATTTFDVQMEKSDALMSCEQQEAKFSRKVASFKQKRNTIWTILLSLAGTTALACGCCASVACNKFLGGFPCPICNYGIMLTSCAFAAMLPLLGNMETKIVDLKAKKKAVCAARTPSELGAASMEWGQVASTMGTMVAGIVCVATVGAAINSGFATNAIGIKPGWVGGGGAVPPGGNAPATLTIGKSPLEPPNPL